MREYEQNAGAHAPPQARSSVPTALHWAAIAGNAHVAATVARAPSPFRPSVPVLAREARYPANHPRGDPHWSKFGEKFGPGDVELYATRFASDLLSDDTYATAAVEMLNGFWIPHIVQAVERIRALGKLATLQKAAGNSGRVAIACQIIADPAGFKPELLDALSDGDYVSLIGAPRGQAPPPGGGNPGLVELRATIAMEQFASQRSKLTGASGVLPDGKLNSGPSKEDSTPGGQPGSSPTPGAQFEELSKFDAKNLPALEALTAQRKGNRWAHPKIAVTDAVLAALQMRGVTNALGQMERGGTEQGAKDVRHEVGGDGIMWCGQFSAHQLLIQGGGPVLKSTSKAHAFFNYTNYHYTEVPCFIKDDAGRRKLTQTYHRQRGSLRTWIPTEAIGHHNLDIRPGDVLTMSVAHGENVESAYGDHVVLVHSYDRTSGKLYTIGGNDGGYIVRQKGAAAPAADPARERAETATGKQLGGRGGAHVAVNEVDVSRPVKRGKDGEKVAVSHVAGIGRPSIVDFETHTYSNENPAKTPEQ